MARPASLGLPMILSDHENRTRGLPGDGFGDASEQNSAEPAAPVTSDDDQIRRPVFRSLYNDICRLADADHVSCPLRNVHGASKSLGNILVIAIRDLQQLIGGKADLSRIWHRRLKDMDRGDLRRKFCGQVETRARGVERPRTAIHRG